MSKRELRSGGATTTQTLDATKNYKLNTSGAIVESTGTPGGTEIVFSGSKSSLRRISDLERNVSILAAKALSDDASGTGYGSSTDYADKSGRWASSRTITLGGDLSGSVSIDGSSNVTLNASVAGNTVALGTDTTGNYMAYMNSGTGISVSHTPGEGSTATVSLNASTTDVTEGTRLYYTDARARAALSASTGISYNSSTGAISCTITQYADSNARGAVSFTAGSGAYNSSTGVFTIPTNNNQITNGAGYITGITSGNVTTALGFTPYNATNPSGYVTSSILASTHTGALSTSSGCATGALTVSGGITATGEITAYYSDDRLKKDVTPITDPIHKLMQIRGVTFRPNQTALDLGIVDKDEVGVIAQAVQSVLPQLVTGSAYDGYITVKYEKLTALLIEAVRAQQQQIDELTRLVAASRGI